MISLHVLTTKLRTKASVPIDTPMPTKPSGQNEARTTSSVRCVNVGLVVRILCATSNTACCVMPLGRITVSETLNSRPASALKTVLISTRTYSATLNLAIMYPSSGYATDRASWNLANTRPHRWCIVRLNINISKGSPSCPPVFPFTK
jgi:hypothetical protein